MSKTVTKYNNAIESFSADFQLALMGEHKLNELNSMIRNKNERLLHDIDLLDELDYGIRYGRLAIVEIPTEEQE